MNSLERRLDELGAHWDAPATPDVTAAVQTARVVSPSPRPASCRGRVRRNTRGVRCPWPRSHRPVTPSWISSTSAASASWNDRRPHHHRTRFARHRGTPPHGARARHGLSPSDCPPLRPAARTVCSCNDHPQDGAFAFVWNSVPALARGELVLTQFRGRLIAEKRIDPNVTTVEHVTVDGVDGVWLSGGPHAIGYLDSDGAFRTETLRRVGDVLVWERLGVTYRIEGARRSPRFASPRTSPISPP